jgi:hypothetical protein
MRNFKTYIVKSTIKYEVRAENEKHAKEKFWEEIDRSLAIYGDWENLIGADLVVEEIKN